MFAVDVASANSYESALPHTHTHLPLLPLTSFLTMPRVPSSASFSLAREDLRSPIERRAVAHFQEVNFTNNFNRSNTVRACHGTQPYPRPQNIWIRASNVDINEGFSDLYLKVRWQCLSFIWQD